VAAVAKLGIAADSYLSAAQRIISRSRVQIPPAACSKYRITLNVRSLSVNVSETADKRAILLRVKLHKVYHP
jgi:hypothetical protein